MAGHAGREIKMTGARSPGKGHFLSLSNYSRQSRSGDGSAPWVAELPSNPGINLTVLVMAVIVHVSQYLPSPPLKWGLIYCCLPGTDNAWCRPDTQRDMFGERRAK